ncbi:right-handed parallel beta-helix repeat-containing protein [bacterium]|nr:right-handed parallel beta-helix repeat-containing protein [bacterium]
MQKRTMTTGCAILALLLALPLLCGATTYYVRTDGNDGNDGLTNTPAGAKATFQNLLAMGDGDTVVFAPGTYDSGGATHLIFRVNVTFRGSDAVNRAVLRNLTLNLTSTANGVTFENLVLDGAYSVPDVFALDNGCSNITLRNCEVRDPSLVNVADALRHGLMVIQGCTNLLVENCRFAVNANADIGNRIHMFIAHYDPFNANVNANWTVRNTAFYATRTVSTDADCAAIYLWHNVSNFLVEGCTFETVAEVMRIVSTDAGDPPRVYSGFTFRNNGIQRVEALHAIYMGSNSVYENFVIRNNYVTNAEDSFIHVPGGGTAVVDGLELSGNVLVDVGYNNDGTDRALTMDEVRINPTPGRRVVIRDNRFVRPSVGADECVWLNLAGAGVDIINNRLGNYTSTALLIDGAESLTPNGALSDVAVTDNVFPNANGIALAVRGLSESVGGVVMERNVVQAAGGSGIEIRSTLGAGGVIRNNTISNAATQGIRVAAPGVLIAYNDVFDSGNASGAGILLNQYSNPSDVSNCIVSYNICAGNQSYGISLDTVLAATSQNVTVMNNTMASNVNGGIRVGLNNCHVWNNIIAFHSGTGLAFQATTPGAIGYNLLYNVLTGGADYSGFVSTPLAGDVLANPQFENFAARDYHLRASSPAIGAGAARSGANLVANGSDLGALPTQAQNLSLPTSHWTLYR